MSHTSDAPSDTLMYSRERSWPRHRHRMSSGSKALVGFPPDSLSIKLRPDRMLQRVPRHRRQDPWTTKATSRVASIVPESPRPTCHGSRWTSGHAESVAARNTDPLNTAAIDQLDHSVQSWTSAETGEMQLVKADQGSSTGSSYPPPVHRTVTDDGILTEPKSEQRKYDPESGKRIGMKVLRP